MRAISGAMSSHLLQPESSLVPIAQLQPPLDLPEDMTSALVQHLDGGASAGLGPSLPLLVSRNSAAVRRSSDLLEIYRILSKAADTCSSLVRAAMCVAIARKRQDQLQIHATCSC